MITPAGLALLAYARLPLPLALLAHAAALVVIARCQRGLECLGHEASHYNWSRSRRRLNDLLGDLLAALPLGARIADYRESHLRHHGRFGTAEDPDRQRYLLLDLEALDRSSLPALARGIAARLLPYHASWWRAIGSDWRTAAGTLAWHLLAAAALTLALGLRAGLFLWATWLLAFAAVLPAVRLLGEADEHVYTGTRTVFDATVTNLGRWHRLLLHPHNDGYHTVHHLWPGVPHHQLARLHRALLRLDPDGYGRRLRQRRRVLQQPTQGA